MKKLLVSLLLLILSAGAFLMFLSRKSSSPAQKNSSLSSVATPSVEEIEPFQFSPEELEKYHQVYENPFVLYLRKCLDAYLANDSSGVNISMAAVEENYGEGVISGLDTFAKEYYKSKFIVVTIDKDAENEGCRHIQIIFQEKPDRIFYAWVCKFGDDDFELRGFNSKERFDEEKMEIMRKLYEPYLNDSEHAL